LRFVSVVDAMPAVSIAPAERARKIESAIRRRMNEGETQAALAIVMGVSPATVNRLMSEHLGNFALLLACLGEKVVPADYQCVNRETYEFLTKTHARVMARAPELIWETEE
jgi:transcriptional regulator with XRE-family HTH domain